MEPVTIAIDAAALQMLRIDEGSLVLKAWGRSEQRVPLLRVRRIDITGCPEDAFDCLVELASRSVPITLFAEDGEVRAQMFNPAPRTTMLAHWIVELLGGGKESVQYRDWREHHMRGLLRAAGLRGGNLACRCREHDEILEALVEQSGLRDAFERYITVLEPLLQARIGEHMLRFGIAPGGVAHSRLTADLRLLADRWLRSKVIHWLGKLRNPVEAERFECYLHAVGSIERDQCI